MKRWQHLDNGRDKGGVRWRTALSLLDRGWSLHSLTLPSLPSALPLATSPLSVRLRNDSLRLRCLLKPLSSSALLGEPGIMLVCNQEQSQGPLLLPSWLTEGQLHPFVNMEK